MVKKIQLLENFIIWVVIFIGNLEYSLIEILINVELLEKSTSF